MPGWPDSLAALRVGAKRRSRVPPARYAWPAGVAVGVIARYGADSLRHRREDRSGYELCGDVQVGEERFLRAAEAITAAPISYGNDVELLVNGDQIFPAMLETIRGARKTVCMLTYAYWKGDICGEIAGALCEQAQAGVDCRVIVDAVGAIRMEKAVLRDMEQAGVKIVRFRPPKLYAMRRIANRTHRKILVADGAVGMIGGVGIASEWEGNAQDPDHWRDTHVRVRGPVVRGLLGAFAENWLEATGDVLVDEAWLPDLEEIEDGGPMQLVRSAAGVGDTNAEALYYLAIAAAKASIDLTAAYFVPRPAFEDALCEAAERGVRVRVLVPGPHIDKNFVRVAGRHSYERLLDCGVGIWEYQPTMLHAKTMTVDGVWASVGSVNFDNRSFQLHDEATLAVQSERFAGLLTEQFERDLEHSSQFEPDRWAERDVRQRAGSAAMKLARREL